MEMFFKRTLKILALGAVIAFLSLSIEGWLTTRIVFAIGIACFSLVVIIIKWRNQHWRTSYGIVTCCGYYVGFGLTTVGYYYLALAFYPWLG